MLARLNVKKKGYIRNSCYCNHHNLSDPRLCYNSSSVYKIKGGEEGKETVSNSKKLNILLYITTSTRMRQLRLGSTILSDNSNQSWAVELTKTIDGAGEADSSPSRSRLLAGSRSLSKLADLFFSRLGDAFRSL